MNVSQLVHDMSASSGLDARRAAQLQQLLEQYLMDLEQGGVVDDEVLIRANPQLAEPLWANVEKLAAPHRAALGLGDGQLTLQEFFLGIVERPESRQLGDFRLLRQIAQGGMGVVYEAEQISLGRRTSGEYLTGQPATWGEGDWDGARGGAPGSPPPGEGTFNSLDIVAALSTGHYLAGPYGALNSGGHQVVSFGGGASLGDVDQIDVPVPEPSGLVLACVGLSFIVALAKSRRRRRCLQ